MKIALLVSINVDWTHCCSSTPLPLMVILVTVPVLAVFFSSLYW